MNDYQKGDKLEATVDKIKKDRPTVIICQGNRYVLELQSARK